MTNSDFIKSCNIPEKLVRAVIRQLGGWTSFKESAPDIANYGVDGGFHGFISYSDTVAFTQRNKAEIMQIAEEQAADFGNQSALGMFTHFNCFKDYTMAEIADGLFNPRSDNRTTIYNGLAWYAAEEVARAYL